MNGGKVIWMIDATNADMDSLSNKTNCGYFKRLKSGRPTFKYGVHVNSNLVEDISSSKIPIPIASLMTFLNELVPWNTFQFLSQH